MKKFRDIKIAVASLFIGVTVGLVGLSFGGTGSVSDAVPGTTIFASDFNKLTSALKVDLVPRNSSGIATAQGGNLGNSTFPWDAFYFGAAASQLSIDDSAGSIIFRTGGSTRATIGATGLELSSLANGLITYAKLNADAIFKLRKFTTTQAVPAGVTEIIIIGCGGGGGGGAGGAGGTYGGGGGGGAGAPIGVAIVPVTALSTVTISTASGGAAGTGTSGNGNAGSTGGTTTVTVTGHGTVRFTGANGGSGGVGSGACPNCAGGAGATSTLRNGQGTIAGGGGANGQTTTNGTDGDFSMYQAGGLFNGFYGSATTGGGGGGGGSSYGVGGQGGRAGAVGLAPPTVGSTGGSCAGGGGGGGAAAAGNGADGGAGGPGIAAVYYVAP